MGEYGNLVLGKGQSEIKNHGLINIDHNNVSQARDKYCRSNPIKAISILGQNLPGQHTGSSRKGILLKLLLYNRRMPSEPEKVTAHAKSTQDRPYGRFNNKTKKDDTRITPRVGRGRNMDLLIRETRK